MSEATSNPTKWYQLDISAAADQLQADPTQGLSPAEAKARLEKFGPNRLAEKKKEPGWHAFLRQYRDFMQIILLDTGLISLIFLQDVRTFLLLFVLTVFNRRALSMFDPYANMSRRMVHCAPVASACSNRIYARRLAVRMLDITA